MTRTKHDSEFGVGGGKILLARCRARPATLRKTISLYRRFNWRLGTLSQGNASMARPALSGVKLVDHFLFLSRWQFNTLLSAGSAYFFRLFFLFPSDACLWTKKKTSGRRETLTMTRNSIQWKLATKTEGTRVSTC